jgi:type IV pilus assembly protein PilO
MTVTRKWSLMAAVLVLAIVAGGWFLLVSPKRSDAAALRADIVTQDEANERLVQQLEVLKAQQADLPRQRARLAVLGTQIPDNPALPTLIRDLSKAGRKVGVSIDTMSPAVPVPVVAAQPVAPVATTEAAGSTESTGSTEAGGTTESTGSSEAGGTTDDAAATAPAPVAPAPSLFQVPLTLNVTGSYFELEQFVNKLEGLKRSFLVTGFTIAEAQGAPTAGSAPEPGAPAPGDLTLALTGRVFLSPEAALASTTLPTPAVSPATGQ